MITMNQKGASKGTESREREANIGGLCANCANLRNCSYANPVNDTWFCEEYVFEQSEKAGPLADSLVVLDQATTPRAGLCANCDLREGCTFPQPPGGVWFCGEYR